MAKPRPQPGIGEVDGLTAFGVILAAIVVFTFLAVKCQPDPNRPGPPPKPALEGGASFTGTQFIVSNRNASDWTGVELVVNGKYRIKTPSLPAGSAFTVGALQVTTKNGERLNPATVKPLEYMVHATMDGKHLTAFGTF